MKTVPFRPSPAFLTQVCLLAAVVAIIVGMLGMHVTTGPFGELSSAGHQHASDVGATSPSSHFSEAQTTACLAGELTLILDSDDDTRCVDISPCHDMDHLSDACIPAPGGSPLAAPAPGLSPLQPVLERLSGSPLVTCGHLPASPSPSELSISRT